MIAQTTELFVHRSRDVSNIKRVQVQILLQRFSSYPIAGIRGVPPSRRAVHALGLQELCRPVRQIAVVYNSVLERGKALRRTLVHTRGAKNTIDERESSFGASFLFHHFSKHFSFL